VQYTIPIGGQWRTTSDKQIAGMHKNKRLVEDAITIEERIAKYEQNPLAFYLPHGYEWSSKERVIGTDAFSMPPSHYDKKHGNDGRAFINDYTHDVAMLVAASQTGKTWAGTAYTGFRVCRCDPTWTCFTEHGITYPEWTGPKIWVVASYSWPNVTTLWNTYRNLLPRAELGQYAPNWGKYPGETGAAKNLTFGDGRPKSIDLVVSGSKLIFLCYSQALFMWEGFKAGGLHADEQIDKDKFVSWSRGTNTMGDYTPCCMTLTGYTLPERPDTGAQGWVKRELYDGTNTRGKSVARYHMSIASVPEAIISKKKKKERWDEWANPAIMRTEKDERAAVARYWGGWEQGSGLLFEEWQRSVHVINPLWEDDKTPRNFTKWRVIDYGDTSVTCCLWFAVAPSGIAFLYRCYYEKGKLIADSAKDIIEMSHNKQVPIDQLVDERTGNVYDQYYEEQCGEQIYTTLLDSRCCAKRQQGQTLEEIFGRYGLEVIPACGQTNQIQLPRFKDWLRVDYRQSHISKINPDGTPCAGGSRLYFFDGKAESVVMELESLQQDPIDPFKINRRQSHHSVDCLKYWASDDPQYFGDILKEESHEPTRSNVAPYTGY